MKNTKLYNNVAKQVTEMQREIKAYAEQLRERFEYDECLIEITSYDIKRERMDAEVNMKIRHSWGNEWNQYATLRVICVFDGDCDGYRIEARDLDSFIDYAGRNNERLSKAAMMTAFCN